MRGVGEVGEDAVNVQIAKLPVFGFGMPIVGWRQEYRFVPERPDVDQEARRVRAADKIRWLEDPAV